MARHIPAHVPADLAGCSVQVTLFAFLHGYPYLGNRWVPVQCRCENWYRRARSGDRLYE